MICLSIFLNRLYSRDCLNTDFFSSSPLAFQSVAARPPDRSDYSTLNAFRQPPENFMEAFCVRLVAFIVAERLLINASEQMKRLAAPRGSRPRSPFGDDYR